MAQEAASVKKPRKKVGIVETEIARNTISGEGIYQVGKDMKAGTYKTSGAEGCYYAILNSTNTSDIADNNNIDGPAFVTVNSGHALRQPGAPIGSCSADLSSAQTARLRQGS